MENREVVRIDGSLKSGSGTILRDAAVFCMLSQKALKMYNIRARRPKPGLRHQHSAFLNSVSEICNGKLAGGSIGSSAIEFVPGKNIKTGKFFFDIGSAGSAVMLALNLIPLGLFAKQPSVYRVVGGLFQDFAPSAFHLKNVLIPMVRKMGADIRCNIVQPGYVPQGRGIIEIQVLPLAGKLNPLVLLEQGKIRKIEGVALSSRLEKRKVSERMAGECRKYLETRGLTTGIRILNDSEQVPVFEKPAVQSGAALAVWAKTETGCIIGADMAGALRRPAEFIGKHVGKTLMEDIRSGACADRFLSDQLIPFAALADGKSRIRIPEMTDHIESRLWLAGTILGAKGAIDGRVVEVDGIGYSGK